MRTLQHVFISYNRGDTRIMRRIKNTFIESGLDVWTDEGIEIGTPNWQLAIERAIESCLCMVCVLTPAAKQSHWVREELVYATFHEKQVYMVHTSGEYKQVAILGFTVAQLVDVRDTNLYQPRMSQLCSRIRDEARGRDITVETHESLDRGMTQKIPEPAELSIDATQNLASDKTVPKEFMPAAIPEHEQHQLIVQRGKEFTATTVFDIADTFVTVGRDKNSTIYIEDGSVSREHCQLIYTNDGFLVRDIDSVNGTYINAERIRIRNLKNKDTLQIGPSVSLLYRINAKGV
jgi:TIR domain/FHA domain